MQIENVGLWQFNYLSSIQIKYKFLFNLNENMNTETQRVAVIGPFQKKAFFIPHILSTGFLIQYEQKYVVSQLKSERKK